MSKLVEQYSGKGATGYDQSRVTTKRFRAEEIAFDRLVAIARPKSVLDLPVGTGRWFPQYKALGVRILGIDASQDMLEEARKKLGPSDSSIELMLGDAFDRTFFESLNGGFDTVVCVRFVNWFRTDQVEKILSNLDLVATRNVLLGVGVWQGEAGSLTRLRARLTVWLVNLRRARRGKPPEQVHEAAELAKLTSNLGWHEVERVLIFSKKGRDSYFVLYQKGPRA